jgi:type III pantothenate kinase
MKADLVADVGNSRIKWGRCREDCVADSVSLPSDDTAAWQRQVEIWSLAAPQCWAVSGVQPQQRDALADWLRRRGDRVTVLESWKQLGLPVLVEVPERVGIDRLLNAVAASTHLPRGTGAVLIDAGSAVTVDWLDETGAFRGGAIFPGLRLMTRALHDYTALLPLVEIRAPHPPMPGKSTITAIEVGVLGAVVGGIHYLVQQLAMSASGTPPLFLTGGDATLLRRAWDADVILWPHMTLEGLRLAAERLP